MNSFQISKGNNGSRGSLFYSSESLALWSRQSPKSLRNIWRLTKRNISVVGLISIQPKKGRIASITSHRLNKVLNLDAYPALRFALESLYLSPPEDFSDVRQVKTHY